MSTDAMKLALKALEHLQPTALTSFYTIGDRDKAITAMREALAQPQPAPVQGWKLVPVDPTPEQINEGNKVTWPSPCAQVYSTMLNAAPQSAQQEPLQNIPSLTTVLAYLERLVPSEVYTGMIDVIEDEFQRKEQSAQQEPVAIVAVDGIGQIQVGWLKKPQHNDKLYTQPPARKPLTDKELEEIVKRGAENKTFHHWFARAIEAAHGIKGDA